LHRKAFVALAVCGYEKAAQTFYILCEHQVANLWGVNEMRGLFVKLFDYFEFDEFCAYPEELLKCISKLCDFERNLMFLDFKSMVQMEVYGLFAGAPE
jgi:hypothetical protein